MDSNIDKKSFMASVAQSKGNGFIPDSVNMNLSKLWKTVKDKEVWHAAVHGVTKHWIRTSA